MTQTDSPQHLRELMNGIMDELDQRQEALQHATTLYTSTLTALRGIGVCAEVFGHDRYSREASRLLADKTRALMSFWSSIDRDLPKADREAAEIEQELLDSTTAEERVIKVLEDAGGRWLQTREIAERARASQGMVRNVLYRDKYKDQIEKQDVAGNRAAWRVRPREDIAVTLRGPTIASRIAGMQLSAKKITKCSENEHQIKEDGDCVATY